MFEGGAYGVGVTVSPLGPTPWDDVPLPPGVDVHPARLGELMPVSARTQAERAAELERVVLVEGQLAAYKAEIVAAMARASADTDDRRPGHPGAASPDWAHDRTCRHPGCTAPAAWADLDHMIPHGRGGPTSCANLCCLCRRHHRLTTHAQGRCFSMQPGGLLSVTTPSGVTRTTRPPGMWPAGTDPPPEQQPDGDPPPFQARRYPWGISRRAPRCR